MERLQKAIAQAGICSRRKAEELILAGKVKVNGKVVDTLGTKVRGNDEIVVNGKEIAKESKVYYVMYKPKGTI
ncbi:S4 domain-containing protein, partial [Dubosiella newyorkensis]